MINFLGLLHNLIFGGDGIELVPGAVRHAMRTIFFSFVSLIYHYIAVLYNLFKNLCNGRLLSGEILEKISSRIGLFLGLIMLFYILIGFVNMLIDPDKIADKKVGAVAIVRKVLIVIVMLGVSRFAFDLLYDIQSSIVSSNAISKLLLPYTVSVGDEEVKDDEGNTIDLFGNVLSEELLSAFYYMKDVSSADEDSANLIESCKYSHEAFKNKIVYENDYELGNYCLNAYITMTGEGEDYETELMHFDWLFAIICGIFTLYLMLMYCIKIGIRMVQLACLEIIAPAPIISYLSPESKMFNTWIKMYFATYIDVFIRIAIINFSTFLISAIFNSSGAENSFIFWKTVGTPTDDGTIAFYGVVMILAILGFAHKLPDLIKQLLPESASKLGFGGMTMKDFAGLGVATGALSAMGMEAIHGNINPLGYLGAAFRGGRAGAGGKSFFGAIGAGDKAQREHRKLVRDIHSKGGSYMGYLGNQLATNLGFQDDAEHYDNQIEREQRAIDQEKQRTAMIRSRNETRAKAADMAHKNKKRGAEEIYTRDFSRIGNVGARTQLTNMQNDLNARKARIEQMQSMGGYYDSRGRFLHASAEQIATQKTLLARREEEASRVYADWNSTLDFDHAMTADVRELHEMIVANKDGAFDGLANTDVTTGYNSLDAFEADSLAENARYSQDIANSDATVAQHEAEISRIKNSAGYIAAQANKSRGN